MIGLKYHYSSSLSYFHNSNLTCNKPSKKEEIASADVVFADANREYCGAVGKIVERAVVGGACGTNVSPKMVACDPCGTITVAFTAANQIEIF